MCPDSIGVKPVRGRRASSELAGPARERREAHVCPLSLELKEPGKLITHRDRHKPRMKPTVRRPHRNRRVYVTGRSDQGVPDGPVTQQVSRLGTDSVGFVVVRHGYTCLSTAVNAYL